MARRNFYEMINVSPINLRAEYERIYKLFYGGAEICCPLITFVDDAFEYLPHHLIGRTLSITDFDNTYDIDFPAVWDGNSDTLISLCEYVYNFCVGIILYAKFTIDEGDYKSINRVLNLISSCMEDIGQMPTKCNQLYIFVAKNPEVISAAEISNDEVAANILEYHHHSLKGNLSKKKSILKMLADEIEPKRKELNGINKSFADLLFQMLQKFVRHNNEDNAYIKSLSPEKLEACYDDIYQMWLLATLEIDHYSERKDRISDLLTRINA